MENGLLSLTNPSKILIIGPERSGCHMLSRMISRCTGLPWLVTGTKINFSAILDKKWIIANHIEYDENIQDICDSNNIKLIGIYRENGYYDSISRIGMDSNRLVFNLKIRDSLPASITVKYDNIVLKKEKEIKKIESILGISNLEAEEWEDRFDKEFTWREKL